MLARLPWIMTNTQIVFLMTCYVFFFFFLLFYCVHLLGATEMFSSLIAPCKYPESRSK